MLLKEPKTCSIEFAFAEMYMATNIFGEKRSRPANVGVLELLVLCNVFLVAVCVKFLDLLFCLCFFECRLLSFVQC